MFNLRGTPQSHLPVQASVDKLASTAEAMKKRSIAQPLPVLEMKEFLPTWAKEVHAWLFQCGACPSAGASR